MKLDGTEKLVIRFSEGLLPVDETLASNANTDGVVGIQLMSLDGSFELSQTTTPTTDRIGFAIELTQEGKVVDASGVTLPVNGIQPQLTPPYIENGTGITIEPTDINSVQNMLFSIDVPSPHTLPSISLTGSPIELLAVDSISGTNVTQFSSPLKLTFTYPTDKILPEQEADLQLFYYNPEDYQWYSMETQVDTVNKTLTALTDHLTVFDYKAANWQSYVPPLLENYQVSEFTGAATYQMDFPAFEGPNGLKPNLTLSYNSQIIDEGSAYTQASWVGMGWSLETGMITRNMHGTDNKLTDDTYMLSLNGLSGRLLPISTSGTKTNYALAQDSFDKIEFDSATQSWTLYSKDGLVYSFGDGNSTGTGFNVKFSPQKGCEKGGGLLKIWGWALREVADRYGNKINYQYDIQKKNDCQNDLAILPSVITYAGGKFEVHFITEDRFDYLNDWAKEESRTLFSTKRLHEIEYLVNGSEVKSYVFSYAQNGAGNVILPHFQWQGDDALTSTLISIQETAVENGGQKLLPATQFDYSDDHMHINKISNGYGGEVTFTYEQKSYFDDFNDNLRSARWRFGTDECVGAIGTSWQGFNGTIVHCEDSCLRLGNPGQDNITIHSMPENIVKPGAKYRFAIGGKSSTGSETGTYFGFALHPGAGQLDEQWFINVTLGTSFPESPEDYPQGDVTMPVDYNINQIKLFVENGGSYIKDLDIVIYTSRYVVTSRTETDTTTGNTGTWTYAYPEEFAMNDPTNSGSAAVCSDPSCLYAPVNTEYRGFSDVTVTRDDGLQVINYYGQTDELKGRLLSSVVTDLNTGQTLSETTYTYKTGEIVSNGNLVTGDGSNLTGYQDLDVLWTRLGSTESLTYLPKDTDGQLYGTGTKTQYDYNGKINDEAGEVNVAKAQGIGNLTGTTYFVKQNDSGWVADYAEWVEYAAPSQNIVYLSQIPLKQRTIKCISGACNEGNNLLQETLFEYYPNWQLKYHREWTQGEISARQYSVRSYEYNADGNLKLTRAWPNFFGSTTVPEGAYLQVEYHYEGFFPNAVTQEITTDSAGKKYSTLATEYDSGLGLPTKVTNVENSSSEGAAYDRFGRTIKICEPGDWDPVSTCADDPHPTTLITYYDTKRPYKLAVSTPGVPGSARQDYYYNGFGELLQSQLIGVKINDQIQSQVTSSIGYDGYGRKTLITEPVTYASLSGYLPETFTYDHHVTQTVHDLLDRVVSIRRVKSDGVQRIASYTYDLHADNGSWLLQTSVADAKGNPTKSLTDVKGQLILSMPPEGTGPATRYTYDTLGQLISTQYGDALTTISYYPSGLKSQMSDADMGTWAYIYDAMGSLTVQIDAKVQQTCLSYDLNHRLVAKNFIPGGGNCSTDLSSWPVRYTYDEGTAQNGYRTGMTDPSGSTRWTYDARGRMVEESKTIESNWGSETAITRWTYNSLDQVTKMTYPSGESVTFSYLPQGSLNSVGGYLTGTTYDGTGQVSVRSFGNGTQTQYTYLDFPLNAGRLGSLTTSNQTGAIQNLSYGYDEVGNVLSITDGMNNGQVQTFAYDPLSRLVSASAIHGNGDYSQTYAYDPATGNLGDKSNVGAYTYDPNHHPHAVTSADGNGNTYTYDANGNMETKTTRLESYQYQYDAGNRLTGILKDRRLLEEYVYDGDGNRVMSIDYSDPNKTTPDCTVYIGNYYQVTWNENWRGNTIPSPTDPKCEKGMYCLYLPLARQGPIERNYFYADGVRIAMNDSSHGITYLYGDHLGSTHVTADTEGALTSQALYQPWGE
ncbi:MAG: SpvB/TcaC N-terminal domain-containing protein, partial [Anaerolineaceae bacterium]